MENAYQKMPHAKPQPPDTAKGKEKMGFKYIYIERNHKQFTKSIQIVQMATSSLLAFSRQFSGDFRLNISKSGVLLKNAMHVVGSEVQSAFICINLCNDT